MKTAKRIIPVLLAAGALVPFAACAQDNTWYLGAAFGQSTSKETCDDVASCDDNDTAWRVFGGYQFNRHLGVELGYADLGTPASASGTVSGVPVVVRVDVNAWDLVAVGSYPIDRFFVYGKVGLYRAETEGTATVAGTPRTTKDTNTDLTFGLGAGFDITRNLRVRAEWQRYQDVGGDNVGEDDIDVISVGLMWRF